MIIWSSINCPIVICLPTVCYFSREKPLVKPTAPGSSFSYIFACDLFSFAFIFRYIKPKIQKYLAAIYLVRDLFSPAFIFRSTKPKIQKYLAAIYLFRDLFIMSTTFTSRYLPILRHRTWTGLTTPLTRRVASICYLCAGVVYVVLRDSPTGSMTLVSSLREIPTVAVLHHPFLFGEIPT